MRIDSFTEVLLILSVCIQLDQVYGVLMESLLTSIAGLRRARATLALLRRRLALMGSLSLRAWSLAALARALWFSVSPYCLRCGLISEHRWDRVHVEDKEYDWERKAHHREERHRSDRLEQQEESNVYVLWSGRWVDLVRHEGLIIIHLILELIWDHLDFGRLSSFLETWSRAELHGWSIKVSFWRRASHWCDGADSTKN